MRNRDSLSSSACCAWWRSVMSEHHLHEAAQLPGRLQHRLDDRKRPEPAAILARAPALDLASALIPGALQRSCRRPGQAVLLREHPGDVLPDGFVRRIAGDPLRARVPTGNET